MQVTNERRKKGDEYVNSRDGKRNLGNGKGVVHVGRKMRAKVKVSLTATEKRATRGCLREGMTNRKHNNRIPRG